MRERLKYLLTMFLLIIAIFATQKPLFMLYNAGVANDIGFADYFMVMLHGLKLDVTMTSYLMAIPALVVLVSYFIKMPLRKILAAYYILIMSIVAIIFVADCTMYNFWMFKLNASVFMYTDKPGDALASVSTWFVIVRLLAIIAFAILYGWLCLKATPKTFARLPKHKLSSLITIPVLGLLFLGIRGGVDESTANISDVYYSDNQFLNHAAVNSTFNMLYTMTKSEDLSKEFQFFDESKREALFNQYYTTQSVGTDTLLTTTRPNVLIVLWEGCGGFFVEAVGGEPGVTPNLNKLAAEGVVFTNCYANSYRTDRGVLSTLSGWLGMPTTSLMKLTEKSSTLPGIAESLAGEGYTTDFWYGGDVGFTNMSSYLFETGYQSVKGDTYFSAEDRNYSKWGAPDHVVLDSVANTILRRSGDSSPWMTTVLTLSSHEPWEVPYDRLEDGKRNSMAYTDHCLGQFIDQLKASDLWSDMLIIILPDHGIRSEDTQTNSNYKVAHIPMVWTGGAVKELRIVPTIMAQSDMAATLLGQLRIAHDEYIFSRDVFSKTYTSPSAFHTFSNGMSLIDTTGVMTFDNDAQKIIYTEAFTDSLAFSPAQQEEKAKAILQTVYKDAGAR